MVDPLQAFEDPSKSAMRERCKAAIEASAYVIIEKPRTLRGPKEAGLFGGIRGDLQSRSRDHKKTHAYYLRPGRLKVAPKWLMNLGELSRHMDDIEVFLVVEESTETLLTSCRTAGVGLLRLTRTDEFELLAGPLERAAADASKAFQNALDSTRRSLENKLHRQLAVFAAQFGQLAELTRGMDDAQQVRYASELEREERRWREWGDELSGMLDEAASSRKDADLKAIQELIDEGPQES